MTRQATVKKSALEKITEQNFNSVSEKMNRMTGKVRIELSLDDPNLTGDARDKLGKLQDAVDMAERNFGKESNEYKKAYQDLKVGFVGVIQDISTEHFMRNVYQTSRFVTGFQFRIDTGKVWQAIHAGS